ncbi:MAG: cytochrome c biogenesis protein ResB, partial [Desulfuromonadaceae bacterium]|nr:cytochrome c biogenesis protein ResB [Desulfuromonadaceae bacterium]
MIKKILKYLSSLRFTILLISLLGLIFAIGLWVPQQRLLKSIYLEWQSNSPSLVAFLDALGLTTIYTSPITITLWLLFFLNLSLVLWQRWPIIKSRITLSDAKIVDPVAAGGYPFRSSYPLSGTMDGEKIIGLLRKNRYTVLGDASGFYGVKNRLAPIAFMLFHLSFFLVLLGGLISVYTEFIGYLDLAQGESFQGEINRYNDSPQPKMPEIGSPPSASFTVKSIVPRVVHNTPTGISVLLVDNNGTTHDVDINRPYSTGQTSFVFKHLGVAPIFAIKDASGREIDKGQFKLDVLQMRPDRFGLAGFTFTAKFYPDYVLYEGKRATRSMEFNNPVFSIVVEREGKKITEGLVPRNGALEFAGYRLEMRDMPFWVRFYVVKQRGLSILYAGFAIATIGVIWRLLFFRREIVGAVREQDGMRCLVVAGRSEYYKSLAEDEFNKLFDGIVGKTDE